MNRQKALLGVRRQAIVVRELEEKLAELQAANLSAAKMDGMPRAKSGVWGLEKILIQKEGLENALEKEKRILQEMELDARRALLQFQGGSYSFGIYYYLYGMSVEESARLMNRSIRQVMRYKREVEGKMKNEE